MAAFVVMAALAASADLPSVASIDGSLDCGQRRLSWRRDLQRRLPITESYDSLPSAPSLSSFLQLQSAGRRVESLEANYFTPDSKPSRRVQKSAMVIHNIRFRANRKPPAVAAELKSVFTVIKLTTAKPEGGDEVGAGAPMVSVRGVHPTEEQAYAAAMLDLLYSLEVAEGDPLPKVRAIAKTKTLPAKDQLKSIQSSCQDSEAAERFEFLVQA